ncbi:MAG: redoxin domain-containing protein [Isosphaeraceae bacterium]|nr:redoxin domain-containing protein [Isosphaeraceae bacterium]
MLRILALLLVYSSTTSCLAADPPGFRTLAIGDRAPDFDLPGVDGKQHRLADFQGGKALVVIFTCNHCPTAQAYEGRFSRFALDYAPKGVKVVAISPNDPLAVRLDELGYTDLGDSLEDMKLRAAEKKFPFPYLYDGETQAVSKAYGVLATPHVYVFDADLRLRYVGRFDDAEVKRVGSHDAIAAVDAVLAGRPVPVEKTRVFGCSTKWSDKRADAVKSVAKWDAEPVALEALDLEAARELAANPGKKLRLVNLWATWCGPCVQELPELVAINRMYRGRPFEMITISLDEPSKRADALEVLRENRVAARNLFLGDVDRDAFAEAFDRHWPGPLPYTVLIAPGGKVIYRRTGAVDPLELKRAIVGYLGRTY